MSAQQDNNRAQEPKTSKSPHLDEANVSGLLTEALTADVQAVLADETVRVAAHTAARTAKKTG